MRSPPRACRATAVRVPVQVCDFIRAPVEALGSLAAAVHDERLEVKRHSDALGSLPLPIPRPSKRLDGQRPPLALGTPRGASPLVPLAERMQFTSNITPVPLR